MDTSRTDVCFRCQSSLIILRQRPLGYERSGTVEAAWLALPKQMHRFCAQGRPENTHLAHERVVFTAAPGTPPVRGLGTIRVKNGPRGAGGTISRPTVERVARI